MELWKALFFWIFSPPHIDKWLCLKSSRFNKREDSWLQAFLLAVTSLPFQALTYASHITLKVGLNHSQWQVPSSFLFKQSLLARDSQIHVRSYSLLPHQLQCSLLPSNAPLPCTHYECPCSRCTMHLSRFPPNWLTSICFHKTIIPFKA